MVDGCLPGNAQTTPAPFPNLPSPDIVPACLPVRDLQKRSEETLGCAYPLLTVALGEDGGCAQLVFGGQACVLVW